MRYSATHKQETRERLLDSSRAIAKRGGFDTTGVDALMSAIGLTGGAFYSHFESKGELFAAMIEREVAHSSQMLAGDENSEPDHVAKSIRNYLSTYHAQHPEVGCGLTTLGPEIARSTPEVRASVEKSLRKTQRSWADRMDGDGDKAWSLIAQCIGAIVMARAVEGERTRQEILAANRRFIDKNHKI